MQHSVFCEERGGGLRADRPMEKVVSHEEKTVNLAGMKGFSLIRTPQASDESKSG